MIVSIKSKDLCVGMYVILPTSWFKHNFFKNQFLIDSKKQIKKIRDSGIDEAKIDASKGLAAREVESITHNDVEISPSPEEEWNPEKDISEELKEAINNKNIPPDKKAEAVYKNSLNLMNAVLDNPTAEVIKEGKKGIANIVDLILSDQETSSHLMNITSHDFYTYTHCVNVGILSVSLSKSIFKGSKDHDLHELGAGFFLHDLGKVRVDPSIINKPGKLTEKEMQKMRIHPYQSYKILEETNNLSEEAKIVAMQHHEREDGTGYPRGLKGDEIHDYGRICCIADVYDALTAKRSYKRNMTSFEALKIMKEEMLGHFHKEIFENFVMLFSNK